MSNSGRCIALLAVSLLLLSSCNGRRVLHSLRLRHHDSSSSAQAAAHGPAAVRVWFVRPDAGGLKVISVNRKIVRKDHVQEAVEELLEGPTPQEEHTGLGTEIPRGTLLLGMVRKGANIELNLSRRFAAGGGSTSFLMRLEQLRKTVAEPAGNNNVYLSVEGHRLNVEEGEGIEIHQPINKL